MKYIVVCTNKDCFMRGSEKLIEAFEQQLEEEGLLFEEVEVVDINCFSLCEYGPNVAVFPDRVVFSHVKLEDVPRIIEYVKGGERPADLEEGVPQSAKRVGLERAQLLLEVEHGININE